jgi:hypothetical protein
MRSFLGTVRSLSLRRAAALGLLSAAAVIAASPVAHARTADLTVALRGQGRVVPPGFLGLSAEYSELDRYMSVGADFVRLLDVLRPSGDNGRVDLRVGGESADSTVWGSDSSQWIAPAYRQGHPYELTHAWLQRLGALVRAAQLNVMLDLNLAAHSPKMAAIVADAARKTLPAGSIKEIGIGDEPDLYHHGLVGLTHVKRGSSNQWAFDFTASDYDQWFRHYVAAVRHVIHGARFDGPEVESKSASWVNSLLESRAAHDVSLVTVHSYPAYDACPGEGEPPRAPDYLRDSAAAGLAADEAPIIEPAAQAGVPVRVTEVGTAVCGGLQGQSNTFATALWAPDALFNMVADGIAGINIHVRGNSFPNTALMITPQGIYPEPVFYGLATFVRTLGPGARLMNVSRTRGSRALKVWVVHRRDGTLRVLYINKSSRPVSVKLRFHSKHPAWLQRLTAPSIYANQTVTLAGQRLGLSGRWQGKEITHHVANRRHAYKILVPADSAALLGVPRP